MQQPQNLLTVWIGAWRGVLSVLFFFLSLWPPALLCLHPAFPAAIALAGPTPVLGDINGGDYTRPITGPATLRGTISVNLSGDDQAALSLTSAQSPIKGDVRHLALSTRGNKSCGINNVGGYLMLDGAIDITTRGDQAHGLLHAGPSSVSWLMGSLSIRTYGQNAHAVALNNSTAGSVEFFGPNTLTVSGGGSSGINIADGNLVLGETSITATGDYGRGIFMRGGSTVINGPLTIHATGTNSYAILITGSATTSTRPGANASPQKLDIDGAIRLEGTGAKLELNLASGSHLNSRLLEADHGGAIHLIFHAPDARWTTGLGSIIHNGSSLDLDFSAGGEWLLPAVDASNAVLPTPLVPLSILGTGTLTLTGNPVLRVTPHTSLSAGQTGTYLMVQEDGGLTPGLTNMTLASGNLLYRLDALKENNINGRPTLEATLTRLGIPDCLPDLGPGPGDLLPDGDNGLPDDGGGNPFLALALAQHFNGLSLDEITSALEGAPALTRALPVAALTRNLDRYTRNGSPVARLYGAGPRVSWRLNGLNEQDKSEGNGGQSARHTADETDTTIWPDKAWSEPGDTRVWLAPLYLHDAERIRYADGMMTRYHAHLGGSLAGVDHTFGPWTLGGGFSLGGGRTTSDAGGRMPRTEGEVHYGGVLAYGLYERGNGSVGMQTSLLRTHSVLEQRNPVMPLRADVTVDALGVELIAVWRIPAGAWMLTPSLGIEYSHLKQHRHVVSGRLKDGSDADLFENRTARQNLWRTPVGLKWNRSITMNAPKDGGKPWILQPEFRLRSIPVIGKTGYALHVRRSDAPEIRTILSGARADRHTLEAGASLGARRGAVNLSVGYTWQGSRHRNAHFLSAMIGYGF